MIRRRIRHRTVYRYAKSVAQSHHYGCLEPRADAGQLLLDFRLEIAPKPGTLTRFADYFGNRALYLEIPQRHRRFSVEACSLVETAVPTAPLDPGPGWEEAAALTRTQPLLMEFALPSPLVPALPEARALGEDCFPPGRPLLTAVAVLNRKIHRMFRYDPDATEVSTPLAEVIRDRHGVCQDFAHLMLAALRARGLAARYVSGYLETGSGPRLQGADASHAWISVHCPGQGWIDADPTNELLPADRHVTLGWARDFADVSPLKGVILGGGAHTVEVVVDVEQIPSGS